MKHMIERRRQMGSDRGFTLIELLIVIAILGILAGVVVFAVGGTTDSAKKSACKIDKASIETAAEAYKADQGTYPPTLAALNGVVGPPAIPAYLKTTINAADWTYTAATGTATATTTGKYGTVAATCTL